MENNLVVNIRLKKFFGLIAKLGAFRFSFWRATFDLFLVKVEGRTRNGHL